MNSLVNLKQQLPKLIQAEKFLLKEKEKVKKIERLTKDKASTFMQLKSDYKHRQNTI